MDDDQRDPEAIIAVAEFEGQLRARLGAEEGAYWARQVRQLVDLAFAHLDDLITERVAPWALIGSKEKIPLDKLSRLGIMKLLYNPDFISEAELEAILADRRQRQPVHDRPRAN